VTQFREREKQSKSHLDPLFSSLISVTLFVFSTQREKERESFGVRLRVLCDQSPMAAPPARARADYDYLIKLLLIGDSG